MIADWEKETKSDCEAFWSATREVSRATFHDARNFFRVSRRTCWKCRTPLCRGKEREREIPLGVATRWHNPRRIFPDVFSPTFIF